MRDRKLPPWIFALTLALCAALAGAVIWQGNELRALSGGRPGPAAESSAQGEAAARNIPESSVRLVKSFDLTPTGVDASGETASADVSVELWDDRPDASAELLVSAGDESSSVPLDRSASGAYTARLTLPLSSEHVGEDRSVSLSVAVELGGVSTRERLEEYPDAGFMTSSLRADLKEGGMTYVRKSLPAPGVGLMRINADCRLSVLDGGKPAAVGDPSFLLYCNGRLMKRLPAAEDEAGLHLYGPQAWDNALVCRNGDEVSFAFSCVGGDGRSYEFQLETARIARGQGDVTPRPMPPAVS